MSKKRYFSLILSILMLLQIIAPLPAQAMTLGQSGVQKSEGQVIDGRSEVFAFKNPKKSNLSWFRRSSQPLFGAKDASITRTETVKINTTATGLDEGDKSFDWRAFGQNKKFRAWIEVAYEEDKKPGETVATERHKVSEDFEISSEGNFDATVTVDASKTVDYYFLKTDYDTDDAAFRINAVLEYRGSLSPREANDLVFNVDIHQIVSTKITYNLLDEYGKAINLNDTKEEKPAEADLKNLGKIGSVTTFDLKNTGTETLWKEQGLDEWDLMDSSLALSLTKNEIKSNNIDYKLSSTYDVINGGTVTIQRQKDAVTPKDPRNPGNIPEGYARLNLSADAQGGKTDGTFTSDDPTDTQRVVDVKAGKAYTTAQAEVDKVTKPFPLTSEKKVDTGKTFDKWTPELSTLGTAVAKEAKTLNATYKSSDEDIIPYLPNEDAPTKDKNGDPIPTNYLTVTFKSEDAAKGKVKVGDKEGETVLAKVKPGIDLSKKAEITTVPENKYGFTKWDPELGVVNANKTFTAYFVRSGSEIKDGDPIPKGWFKVTVSQDNDSIVANTVETKSYIVEPNDTLAADKFASLDGNAKEGYVNPAWYVGSEKIANPHEKPITTSTDFVAKATELDSNKITKNGGLKAVDITAFKGDEMGKGFWKKGVALNKENDSLQKLLDEATVTDITDPKRTTEKAGTFEGTLKVTFDDGSTIEVKNQKLIVKDTNVNISFDKEAKDDANAPRHNDEVVKGKITTTEAVEGAIVEVKDAKGNSLGKGFANADGTFNVGTKRPLKAGEDLSITVTLPEIGRPSDAVTKKVGLNPDKLNNILPTADKLLENLKGKPGVSKAKLDELEKAIKAGKDLIDETTKKPAKSVTVDAEGQKSLDGAYATIKKAMEDLTENKIPMINGPDHKEIFVGGEIDLDEDIKVVDDNIKQVDGKDYTYKIYDASGAEVKKAAMVAKDGVYRVVYSAEDAQGVKASHTMTVVVKKTVVEVPGEFPKDIPEGYVKVEFKSGDNAGLNGVSKFLVQKGAQKSVIKEPTIIPKEGYKVADPKWSKEIPATFAKDFETEAQVIAKVTTTEPDAKDKAKYATLTFEAGEHGEFEENAKTTVYVLKNEKVSFNAPKIKANDGFTFAGWEPELKDSYEADQTHTAKYASNSDISDTEVKGFQEVKFVAGKDGNFGNDVKEKSVWVRPGKLVDLRTKAPKVTVTTEGKSFIGWDKDLVQTFTKAKEPTVINAKYDDTVKTEEPKENKEKYAKVDFSAGNLGTIADDATKTYWVVKDAEVKLTPPTVKANEGWKLAENAWKPAVATKYTQDTIHVAQYDYNGASVIPQKPGEDKPVVPENFVKVEFKKGEHGVISSEETTVYWVDPTKEVELKAPAVIADKNYKHDGWNKELKNTFAQKTDIVAQYKSTVVTEDPKDANYVTVEFDAKDHGTLKGDAKFWVYKNEKVSITAPEVTAKDGYTFDKWDPAVKDSYAEATVHNATYTTNNNVSDTEVEGYNKVTFKAGDHGTLTEKSVWVKPDTVVDLNDKAPAVTPEKGYSHIGWKPALIGKFENNTVIVAQYSNSISDKPVEGWTELTFDQGDHGKFAKGAKNVKWVNPKVELKLKDIAPAIVADTNYSLDGWKDGETKADLEKAQKFETAKTFTATYKSNVLGKDEHGNLPEDEKKNFVQITFNEGKNGKFPKEAVKEVYVKKDVAVDLTEKAPTVIPNQGYGHNGWNPALKGTFSTATTITAQYKEGTFDENAIKEIMVVGPTKMGYGEGEKLDLTGLKVIAKDDAGLQKTYDGVDAIKAAGYTIAPANETVLTKKDHDGQPIKVTKGEGNDKVEGKTETTLTIHENKSAKAEDVKALNQNKVVDGKVTNEPKDTTTVSGKVKLGSTVIIKDEGGNDITPQDGVKVKNDGTFTAEVKKQEVGKKVQVIVTEEGKQPSEPADATVARDANNDGKDDNEKNQRTATPTAKALNQGAEPKVTTITGKAEPGAKVVAKVGDVKVGEATADAQTGEYKIEAKKDGAALGENIDVKVTAQVEGKLESEPATATVKIDKDGNGIADKDEQTERPAAIASNKGKTPTFTTIKGKTEKGATITVTVKVNGEEKPVTVDNLKVNDDGTYTLEAKYNGKPLDNGAEILVYATNAPKTKSAPQTTTVFDDFNNDGKPDGGKVDLKDVKDIQVIAPNKMSYTEGDKLDGTGLKAVVRDNKGGIEIFEYDNENGVFKNADNEKVAGITATVADKAVKDLKLTEKDHDGKAIDVKVGDKTGSTNQTLEVKQLQTPTPSIEFAANQNTVGSDGKTPTGTAKQKTTVKFTVKNKPTTVYVKYTVNDEAKEESFEIGADGELTKTVDLAVKLPVGTEVKVLAKDADKTLSEAATAKVVRDANNDGTADDKTPVGKTEIDPIKAQSESITVKPADNATELVIKETDKSGNTPEGSKEITVKKDSNGNWTIDGKPVEKTDDGKLVIPTKDKLKLDEYNVVEVDAKGDPDTTTPSTARETVGQAADITAPDKPVVDQPVDGDKNIKVKTPTDKDAKTITVEVEVPAKPGEQPAKKTVVIEKGDDGKWKTTDGKEVPEENGKLVIPVDPAVKKGDTVVVEVKDDSGNASKSDPQTVVERETLPVPTIDPIKSGGKTVSGKAEKAATVDIYKKNAQGEYDLIKGDVGVSADGSYTYNHTDGFKDGDVIRVVAKKPGMTPSNAEATVGVDTSALDKAITDGKGELEKRKDGTPADKALEDAIKEGEKTKGKTNPAATQDEVNAAKDKIEKAIEEKKAYDKAKDKLKEKIKEAEDKKQDPEYPTKPDYAKKELEESANEGANVDKDKTSSKESIDKAIEKIQEKLDQYNKQQIGVNVRKVTSNDKSVVATVTAPNAKVEVFKSEFDLSTYKEKLTPIGEATSITRIVVVSLDETLPKGTNLFIKVTHPDYLSYENTEVVE